MKYSNEQLVSLLQKSGRGDHAAFERLYRATSASLNAYAFRFTKCEYLSNEVLQESFTQIWTSAEKFNAQRSKPVTWMYMIVRSRALDKLRAEKKHVTSEEISVAAPSAQPERLLIANESKETLHASIADLPKKMAQCVELAYFNDYSREDLAQNLDANVNTVKSWLHRGLKNLKQSADKEQIEAFY